MRELDITKTGSLNYNDLQNLNNIDYAGLDEILERSKEIEFEADNTIAGRQTQTGTYNLSKVLPKENEYKDLFNSKYDRQGMNLEEYEHFQDLRGQKQGTLTKWGSGLTKMVSLAGTTFLDGTVGLVFGAGQALAEGRWSAVFDNKLSNALQEWNDYMEKALPNYRTQEEMERPWYQNLGTANFWADNILKNAGFTIGAFYSGNAWLGALRGLNWVKRGATANMIGSLISGVNEGRIEGNNARRDYLNLESQKLDDQTELLRQQILASDMSDIEKANALQDLDIRKQQLYQDIVDRSERVGMETLGWNVPLLTMGNMWQFGKLYARGFEEASDMTKRIIAKGGVEKTMTQRVAENIGYDFKEMGKTAMTLKGVSNAVWEAQEEMSQGLVSAAAAHRRTPDSPDSYYKALVDEDAQTRFAERANVWSRAFADTYGNPDMWQEGFAGFVMGAFGMPTVGKMQNSSAKTYLGRGKTIGLSGGILGDIFEAREMNRKGNETVEAMNKYIDKLSKDKQHFIRSESFTNDMDGYAAEGDKFEYINAKDNDDFEAIKYFNEAGKLDDYREIVNQPYENMSREQLQDIAEDMTPDVSYDNDGNLITKDSEGNVLRGGWRNTDGTLMSDTEQGTEEMRQELIKRRDKTLKGIDDYIDSYKAVVNAVGDKVKEDDKLNELAWLHWKVKSFNERFKEVKEKSEPFINTVQSRAEELLNQMNNENLHIVRGLVRGTENFETNKKNLEDVVEAITELNNSKNAIEFANNIRANSLLLAVIEQGSFPTQSGEFSILEDAARVFGGLESIDANYKDRFKELRDLSKLASSAKSFNDKYKEYTENPEKIQENRNKINSESAKRKEEKDKEAKNKEVADMSVQDLVSEGIDLDPKDFDAMDGFEASLENQQKIDKAKTIIDKANSMKEAVAQMASDPETGVTSEDIAQYNAMINEMATRVDSPDELDDITSGQFNDIMESAVDPDSDDVERDMADVLNTLRGISDVSKYIQEERKKVPESNNTKTTEPEEKNSGHDGEPKIQEEHNKPKEKITEEKPEDSNVDKTYSSERVSGEEETLDNEIQQNEKSVNNDLNNAANNLPKVAGTNLFWGSGISHYFNYGNPRQWTTMKQYAQNYPEAVRKKVEAVYDFLEKNGVFKNRESDKSPQKGDKLRFKTFSEVNAKAETLVIFLVDENDNIVGNLPSPVEKGANSYANMESFLTRFQEAYEKEGSPEEFTLTENGKPVTITVEKLLIGKPMYSEEYRTLNEVFKGEEIKIGIVIDDNGTIRTSRGSASTKDTDRTITLPSLKLKKGNPVVLLKTSDTKGTRQYIPVPFNTLKFGEQIKGTVRYNRILEVLDSIVKIAKGESKEDLLIHLQKLQDNIANEFRLDIMKNGNIRLKLRESDKVIVNTIPDNFVNEALKALDGMTLQVARKFINTKDYNSEIGEIAMINLSSTHTVNDGFITSYINSKGQEAKADFTSMNSYVKKETNPAKVTDKDEFDVNNLEAGEEIAKFDFEENQNENNSINDFAESLSPAQQAVFNLLNDIQKKDVANNPDRIAILDELSSKYSKKTKSFREGTNVDEIINSKGRVAEGKYEKTSIEKEIKRLEKVLPQLNINERTRIAKGLLKARGSVLLWGSYYDGIINISDTASRGTVYHEAFHAVCDMLLEDGERKELFDAARQQYGNMSEINLEEKLAEDFRKYMQIEDIPVLGKIVRMFRMLKNLITNIKGKENYINNLFYNISRGELSNKELNQKTVDKAKEIQQSHNERYDLNNLTEDESSYLKDSGISNEEYVKMTPEEKERFFKCRV